MTSSLPNCVVHNSCVLPTYTYYDIIAATQLSRVEIEDYSVAYFNCIAVFEALYH